MNKMLFNRNAVLGAVLLGISGLTLSGCGQKTSEEHMLAARQFVEAKDNQSAIIEYKSAIQKDPQDSVARFELGKLYVELGNFAAAEKELSRSMELGHKVSEILPLITLAYQETNSEVALSEIDHSIDGLTAVERAQVAYYKLEALLRLEKKSEARALLADIEQIDTSSVYRGLSLAMANVLDDDYEKALEEVNTLQAQAPMNKDVLIQQARLHMFLRNIDEAVAAYQAYLDVAKSDNETKFILTAILMDAKRFDEAEPLIDELLTLSATNALLNHYKGVIKSRQGEYADALAHFDTAIQNGHANPVTRLLAGYSAYQLNNYEETTRHLSMIASELPPSHAALRMLADSLLQLGKNEEATDILSRVDGAAQNDAMLFSKAGYQLLKTGNVVDARAMIEKSVPIATTAEDLTRIGVLQLSLNDAEGLVNLEAAVEQAPEFSVGQQTLANAYIATGQYDKAMDVASTWQQQEPESALPLLIKAQVNIARQQYDAAESMISQAEALDSSSVKAKVQRVSLAMLQNQPDQALDAAEAALQIDDTDQTTLALYYLLQKQIGDAPKAISRIEQVISRNPQANVPKVVLARILLAESKFAEGIEVLQPVSENDNTPELYWDTKGRLLLARGNINDAKTHYETWVERQPNNKIGVLGLSMILDLQNRFDEGLQLTNSFLEKRPDRQVLIIKAHFQTMLRQVAEAEAVLATLSSEERALPYVKAIQARLLVYKDKPQQALAPAKEAYQAIENSRNLLLLMAVYEMLGESEQAFTLVENFVEKNPTNGQAMLLYAERLIGRDRQQAIKVYRDLAELQPGNAIALNNLAYLEHQEGMLDEAEKHARQALEIVSDAAEIADTLAQILIDMEDLEEAKRVYDTVMDGSVGNEEVVLNYVELLLRLDMTTLAKRKIDDKSFESPLSQARLTALREQYSL